MNQNKAFKLKDTVICEMIDQELILFDPDTNCIINLNKTASKICEFLQCKINFEQLVKRFYDQFQETGRPPKEVVENDVRDILEKLDKNRVLLCYEM